MSNSVVSRRIFSADASGSGEGKDSSVMSGGATRKGTAAGDGNAGSGGGCTEQAEPRIRTATRARLNLRMYCVRAGTICAWCAWTPVTPIRRSLIAEIARAAVRAGAAIADGEKRSPCRSRPALGHQPSAAITLQARFTRSSPARSRWPARTAARALEQIWGNTSKDDALPSRAVPVLDGRARLERATCCGVSLRRVPAKLTEAGKPARRFPRRVRSL